MNHNISNVGKPTLFHQAKSIEKNIEKIQILTQSIEKSYWKKILREDKYWHNQLKRAFKKVRWPQNLLVSILQNFQVIIFIWTLTHSEIFKSALLYL